MRTHNVAVIPGDGIGTEVIGAGKKVLEALAKKNGDFTFNFEEFDWSSQRYLDELLSNLVYEHQAASLPD